MSLQTKLPIHVAYIREQAAQFLIDTCDIVRKTGETVVRGVPVITYAAPEQTACRIIARSGSSSSNIPSQERVAAQTTFTSIERLQLPFDTIINLSDYIIYHNTVNGTDEKYEITFIPPRHAMMGAFVIGIQLRS